MTIILNGTTGVTFPDGTTQTDGLSTPVPVADGGTGSATAADARTALSAAKSGANSDITSITGLTTPLSAAQGGTGASSLSSITVGTATNATNATNATTATNLAGGGAGQIPYQSASGTTAMLAAGTSGYYLQSNGTSAPSWTAVSTTPTTNQVLSATAGGTAGAIGTYAFMLKPTNDDVGVGGTYSGSSLVYSNVYPNNAGAASGTWRCMGRAYSWASGCEANKATTLWLRIS